MRLHDFCQPFPGWVQKHGSWPASLTNFDRRRIVSILQKLSQAQCNITGTAILPHALKTLGCYAEQQIVGTTVKVIPSAVKRRRNVTTSALNSSSLSSKLCRPAYCTFTNGTTVEKHAQVDALELWRSGQLWTLSTPFHHCWTWLHCA